MENCTSIALVADDYMYQNYNFTIAKLRLSEFASSSCTVERNLQLCSVDKHFLEIAAVADVRCVHQKNKIFEIRKKF